MVREMSSPVHKASGDSRGLFCAVAWRAVACQSGRAKKQHPATAGWEALGKEPAVVSGSADQGDKLDSRILIWKI
jgi:hypothetical protein